MAGRSMNTSGPTLQSPVWAGDFGSRDHLVPGGAKLLSTAFVPTDGTLVVVDTAGAAANDTSIPLASPLTADIPNNTVLYFGAAKKFARLSAAAAAGDTDLTVQAIPTALVDGDTATYMGTTGRVNVLSGTIVGRTIAERDASTGFGPAESGDDEIFIVYHDVDDILTIADCELYRHGGVVKENFLPAWDDLDSDVKALVRAAYLCTRGAE